MSGTPTRPGPGEPAIDTPVLIVGAGPVGLSLSIALGRAGVPSLAVERHPGTAIHPKARGVNVRAMEIFRQWELDDDVRKAGLSAADSGFFFRGPTLTAGVFRRFGGGGQAAEAESLSPSSWMVIAQDALEPVLLHRIRATGIGQVRFRHELTGFEATAAGGVRAEVVDRESGQARVIHAAWLVGADGAASPTREQMGIPLIGHGPLVRNASILFRAALGTVTADRRSAVYYLVDDEEVRPRGYPMSVGNPPPKGALLAINNDDRWLLVIGHDGDEGLADLDVERCIQLVRRAVGIENLSVEILSLMPWTPAARVAERYQSGSVFLAGDAAHEMTPSGAFGLNVGIGDAHNLGWKLGAVVRGWANAALLETYDAERRPVGSQAAEESYLQFSGARSPRPFGNWGVTFGGPYELSAVVPDGTPAPQIADPVSDYVACARPGHRAPHAPLRTPAGRCSTLDLFGDEFVVLTGSKRWARAAETSARSLGLPIAVRRLGPDLDPEDAPAFERLYGIGADGAVLVRPDGYVAWRSGAQHGSQGAAEELEGALRQVLDRRG